MKRCYIVSYDICDDRRLRRVAQKMEDFGTRLQYSVFRCELTEVMRAKLELALKEIVNHREDQVLFIDLGPAPGRADECITALGRKYMTPPRGAIVL